MQTQLVMQTCVGPRALCAVLLVLLLTSMSDVMSLDDHRSPSLLPADIVIVTGISFERHEIIKAARAFR